MANRYHPVTSAIRSKTVRAAHSAVPGPRPSGAGVPLPSGYLAALLSVICAVGFALGTPLKVDAQTSAPPQPTLVRQELTGGGNSDTGGSATTKDQFVVFWDTPQVAGRLATAYELQYKKSSDGSWTTLNANIPPVASARTTVHHTDVALTDGACYAYRVRAKNSAGVSAYTETNKCKNTRLASAASKVNAPPRPTAVVDSSDATRVTITVMRPLTSNDSRVYYLARRPAGCSTAAYTRIRDTSKNSSNVSAATVTFTLTNNSGTGTGRVPTSVNNAEPTGTHLYRASIPGPNGDGSWSLPVAVRTNSDGTKEYINHVASASEEARHNFAAGTCELVVR